MVSFIGGGNQSTQAKSTTYRKSLTLDHTMLYQLHIAWAGFELTTLVVLSTNCIGSCKSNYYTITTAPDSSLYLFDACCKWISNTCRWSLINHIYSRLKPSFLLLNRRPKREAFLPVHLYGELVQHEEGYDLLKHQVGFNYVFMTC